MFVLGIETSTKSASAALIDQDRLLGEFFLNAKEPHSQTIIPIIDELLKQLDIKLNQIDAIAVCEGPGAFTGLRVGLAAVKGLAMALSIPVICVSSLDILVSCLPFSPYLLCPILDARKKEVYTAFYKWKDGKCRRLSDYMVIKPEALADKISEPAVFLGDGVAAYRGILTELLARYANFTDNLLCSPRASRLAYMGLSKLKSGEALDYHKIVPLYIRRPEAEVAWDAKQAFRT